MNHNKKYVEFLHKISKCIEEIYEGEVTAQICTSMKNNGVLMTGLMLKRQEDNIAPNFYMEKQFQEWECGEQTFKQIVTSLCKNFENELETREHLTQTIQFEWESVKESLFMRLVNREKNQDLLKKVPYVEFLDLAVIYFYSVDISKDVQGTVIVTKEHQEFFGVTTEQLHEVAKKNTKEKSPSRLYPMDKVLSYLKEKMEVPMSEGMMEQEMLYMYILTNTSGMFGSVSMFFEEELKNVAQQLNKNLYVLPCSIHEVILVPDNRMYCIEGLAEMVRDINATQVQETEVLSDSVYYYDKYLEQLRRVG